VNFLFRHVPSAGVLVGGTFIVAGAAIIYFGIDKRTRCRLAIPLKIHSLIAEF
jgi:hypothetical protein